jgi:hypothetical protein
MMPENTAHDFSRRNFLRAGSVAAGAAAVAGAGLTGAAAAAAAPQGKTAALDPRRLTAAFQHPTAQQKAMTRTWFPDAALGGSADGLATVRRHFLDMAAAGFGGAEIAMLADLVHYDNADAQTIGFGSQNWKQIVREVLRTANSVPGGFTIDLTLSQHWPVAVNVIDPNDDGQQQQAVTAYAKITADSLAAGTVPLPLPPTRLQDQTNGGPGDQYTPPVAPFIFASTFVAAAVAKVSALNGSSPVFELASVADVSGQTAAQTVTAAQAASGTPYRLVNGVRFAGSAAGVPDQAWAQANGISYATILGLWGPEPASPNFPGKIDAAGDRRRMADWQYRYQTDLAKVGALAGYTPSSGTSLAVGDYALVGIYRQGTGQLMSGGESIPQYNRCYVIDIYDAQGVSAVSDFWYKNILDDEIIGLLRQNASQNPSSCVFEDSFEVQHTGQLWPARLLAAASEVNGYPAGQYALVYALGSASDFDDAVTAGRLLEDYVLALSHLYENEHIAGLKRFAAAFGHGFKNQSEAGSAGVAGAEPGLSVVEGDNGAGDEGWRNMAAAAALAGTNLVSDEALTFVANAYDNQWLQLDRALNQYWGTGVNRVNLHGTPFPKTFNDYDSPWPGWQFDGLGAFTPRQVWWPDAGQFSGYIARSQSVVQAGVARADLAVLEGSDKRYTLPSTPALPLSLTLGYSYHVLDERMLGLPMAQVTGGVLAAGGPAYQALIVHAATELSVAAMRTLTGYARAGLPVVLLDCAITRVYGTSKPGENDTLLASELAVLAATRNVYQAGTEQDALSYLAGKGVAPAASYSAAGLLTIHRQTRDTHYYYLYCEGTTLTAAAAAGATGITVASTAGLAAGQRLIIDTGASQENVTIASVPSPAPASGPNVLLTAALAVSHAGPSSTGGIFGGLAGAAVSAVIDTTVSLSGYGAPYRLDAWTGDVRPLGAYQPGNGSVTVSVTLRGGEAAIIALSAGPVPGNAAPHATSFPGGTVTYDATGQLVHRALAAGGYEIALSQGRTQQLRVTGIPAVPPLAAGWDLTLQSWGPDPAANATDPEVSAKTTVSFTDMALGQWSALPATAAQLSALGVASMSQVSGIGTYSTTFTLPGSWTDADGAYLVLAHNTDMITGVTINGHAITAVNQFTDTVDLGGYLRAGVNTLVVRLDSTFGSRVAASPDKGGVSVLGSPPATQPYGLSAARLVPYIQTVLSGA